MAPTDQGSTGSVFTTPAPVEDEGQPNNTVPIVHTENRYFKRQLNRKYWVYYEMIVDGLFRYDSEIGTITAANYDEVKEIITAVRYDYPELFWFTGGLSYTYRENGYETDFTLKPQYRWSNAEIDQKRQFVERETQPIIASLQGKSDYEKVKGVYEYLVDQTAYDYDYSGKTLYELFYNHRSVCEGYARATQYLLNKLGIETIYVLGSSYEGESHAWNIVLVDGEYYQVDVTWGDPYSEDGTQTKNFNYLCLTTEDMARDHISDWSLYPSCTSKAANYYIQEGFYLDFYDTDLISYWFSTMTNTGDTLMFKCAAQSFDGSAQE